MKKFISLFLVSSMLFSFAGCKKEPQPQPELTENEVEIDINDLNAETPAPEKNEEVSEPQEKEVEKQNEEQPEKSEPEQTNLDTTEPPKSETKVEQAPQANTEQEATKVQEVKSEATVPENQATQENNEQETLSFAKAQKPVTYNEKRAVWISYLDFNTLLKNKTQNQFKNNINNAFKNIVDLGLNTVIVQVRPYADALYPSDYFPWSHTITGTEGQNPGFDPLAIMVKEAKNQGLKIEAWVNPYRVRSNGKISQLSNDNIAKDWAGTSSVKEYNGGIYFNPACENARELIVNGVKEIVTNYDVDAIHFDDYFYPTTNADFDCNEYQDYVNGGGSLSLGDWRRENVNELVREVYSSIKQINSSVEFGISPQSSIERNYNSQYVDAKKWLSNSGYVDYIMPQIYHGFNNSAMPFKQTAQNWNNLIKADVDLQIGLSPYKIGKEDVYAGNGKYEWIESEDILTAMVETARNIGHCNGFAMFRYDSIINPPANVKSQVNTELDSLSNVLG